MGNYTLVSLADKARQDIVTSYYTKKIGQVPVILNAGDYNLIYCNKALIAEPHLFVDGENFICFSGTPVLKGTKTISETVSGIYNMLLNDQFDPSKIRGSYSFVFYRHGKPV